MAPGPVMMPPQVYQALSAPMVHHRTPVFSEKLKFVLDQLPRAFGTTQPVMMLSSTGSGAMEAAVVNTLAPGDKALCVVAGKFGERWSDMAQCFGIEVKNIEVPWGQAVDLQELEEELSRQKYTAVMTQACETSTATWQPVQEMSQIIARTCPETLLMVDGITAVASSPLKMDEWKIDVLVAGSQKAFMLPAGLSFVSLSERAWKKCEQQHLPYYYWNLKKERQANLKQQTFFSSNVSLISALYEVLKLWQGEGLAQQIKWYQDQQRIFVGAVEDLGLSLYSQNPSPSVTAVNVPEGVDGVQLRDHLEQTYQLTVMGGQEHLKGKIIRIGHMGHIEKSDIYACIYYIAHALQDLKWQLLSHEKVDQVLKNVRKELAL